MEYKINKMGENSYQVSNTKDQKLYKTLHKPYKVDFFRKMYEI